MTHKQFYKFCKSRKPDMIEPTDFGGFKIYFNTGEYITVNSDRDGLSFTHQFEEPDSGNKQLLSSLQLLTPQYYEGFLKKYGNQELISRNAKNKSTMKASEAKTISEENKNHPFNKIIEHIKNCALEGKTVAYFKKEDTDKWKKELEELGYEIAPPDIKSTSMMVKW